MNYRIVEKEPFSLAGFKKRVPIIFGGINPEITKMTEFLTTEVIKELKALSNVEPTGIISASTNFSEGRMQEMGELDHYIGVATSSDETGKFDVLKIDAYTWAVFEFKVGYFYPLSFCNDTLEDFGNVIIGKKEQMSRLRAKINI